MTPEGSANVAQQPSTRSKRKSFKETGEPLPFEAALGPFLFVLRIIHGAPRPLLLG